MNIVQNSADPPQDSMHSKSLNPPSLYRKLDILTLKVWKYKIGFQKNFI